MSDMTAGHVSDELIAAYLDRTISASDREQVENHLLSCKSCRATVLEAARALAPGRRGRLTFGIGVAAAAALALFIVLPRAERETPSVIRSGTTEGPTMEVVSEWNGDADSPRAFVWRAIAGSLRYHFELVSVSGRLIWDTTTTDTTVTIPNSVMLDPDSLLWSIDALMEDGGASSTGYRPIEQR